MVQNVGKHRTGDEQRKGMREAMHGFQYYFTRLSTLREEQLHGKLAHTKT